MIRKPLCQISLILFLKANHNVVTSTPPSCELCQISLILFLKANHNRYFDSSNTCLLCQISLILFLKANHNFHPPILKVYKVVSNIVNSVFESKPQLASNSSEVSNVVSNIVNSVFESKPQLPPANFESL